MDPCIAAKEWQKWSPLAHTLLTLWGQGEISAPTVQKIAHAAVLSGCPPKDAQDFAALGTFGKHHQNCHRDLMKNATVIGACLFACDLQREGQQSNCC